MKTINIDNAPILEGNHIGAVRKSCNKIDRPTNERVICVLDGKEYERTMYERKIWRNQGEHTVIAKFVWINGKFYKID